MPNPDTVGQQHAMDVEHKLLNNDVKGAEETFRQHYLDAMKSQNPDDQKAAEAERAALKNMDPSGYKLVMLELAKDTGVLTTGSQSRGDLKSDTLQARLPDATPDDKLQGMVAQEMLNNYDELTGGFRHDVSNIFSPGASSADANRLEQSLQDDLHKRQMASTAEQTFLANNGEVFDKIAGISGHFDRDALEQAIKKDAEAKKNGQPGLFTDDQLKQVKWMDDNWYDPAVSQLRQGDSTMFDPSNRFSATVDGVKTGWDHAFGANFHGLWRPINGVAGAVDAVGEGLWGLVTGDKIKSYVNKNAMEKSVQNNFGSDDNANAMAGGGTPEQAKQSPDDKTPKQDPNDKTPKQDPNDKTPKQDPDDKTPKQDPDDKTPKQDPDDKTPKQDPDDKQSSDDQDPDVVRKGEGYTYVATRLLGLVPGDASTQDVEKAFQKLSKEQKAEVLSLSQALQESNKKKHNGVLWAGDRVDTDDPKVQAILNPDSEDPGD
jgi:hypothetical protein